MLLSPILVIRADARTSAFGTGSCQALLPAVVVQLKDWKVSPDLFPVEASADTQQLISTAVKAAVGAWGALAAAVQGQPAAFVVSMP